MRLQRLRWVITLLCPLLVSSTLGQKPSILFVTIDTLRADRVGTEAALTPALDSIAADGVVFERAIAQVPITLPSHVSIMTGTYPMFHGIRDFGGFRLPEARETLAEILRGDGYVTVAFVSSFALDSQWGLDQGFDYYDDDMDLSGYSGIGFNAVERRGDETVKRVLQWLSGARTPFFLWVHLFDPHDPYEPPEPWATRHKDNPYDGEVAFADSQLERLIAAFKEKEIYDSSLIVVMGDHGEGLGEHGEETHGFYVYNSTLHIPLVIKFPENGNAGRRIREVVQSIDVAPTLLQTVRAQRGSEMQGRGLLSLLRSGRSADSATAYGESLYARYHFGWSSLTAYQDEKFKYIRSPKKELYDLRADPGERHNLYLEQTALANQYDSLLTSWVQKYTSAEANGRDFQEVDAETRQRLQSLGYITLSSGKSSSEDDLGRPDPKDKLELFQNIRTATLETEKRQYEASIRRLLGVIEEDPGIYAARYLQGFNFFQTAQYLRAVEEFKAALELFPDAPVAIHSLAMSYLRLGIDDAARMGFERLLQVQPESPDALIGLGGVSLRQKNTSAAKGYFESALKIQETPEARLGLGKALIGEESYREGIEQLKRAVAARADLAEAHFLLGYAYQKLGEDDRAALHYAESQRLSKKRN